MKTAALIILLLAITLLLTGCGHYGMGMHHGGHWYSQSHPQPDWQSAGDDAWMKTASAIR